jgi:hypothetical protein
MRRTCWLALFPVMLLVVNPLSEITNWRWPMRFRAWWENF